MTQYKFTVNSQSEIGTLTWNADHMLQSLDITDPFNSADTQNCSFAHDDLTRIASVDCGSIWSHTFTYDAFGNISKSGREHRESVVRRDAFASCGHRYDSAIRSVYKNVPAHWERNDLGRFETYVLPFGPIH
jgi:YD repeat-containing protein